MENTKLATLAGTNCKKIRESKGITQTELGERIGVTAQNISKYERNGISDIDTIKRISEELGQDLLKDLSDQEGSVGEVGSEILRILIDAKGFIFVDSLNLQTMYGMSKERISEEIFKLVRIGLCYREQFCDWTGFETDGLFITAKGLIVYKHHFASNMNATELQQLLNQTLTYEMALDDSESFQEYISNHPAEELIHMLVYENINPRIGSNSIIINNCHRANYIQYLKTHFETGPDVLKDPQERMPYNPGVSCYHDILYRMATDISNDFLWNNSLHVKRKNEFLKEYNSFMRTHNLDPGRIYDTVSTFDKEFPWIKKVDDDGYSETIIERLISEYDEAEILPKETLKELEKDNRLCYAAQSIEAARSNFYGEYDHLLRPEETLKHRYINTWEEDKYSWADGGRINNEGDADKDLFTGDGYKCKYPLAEWFTVDDIKAFINANMAPASTEQEKLIDSKLRRINELMPETLDYYRFPNEWENNGIADLIRHNIGIERVK